MAGGKHGSRLVETEPIPFDVIGGADTVDALVERFYAEMDSTPQAQGVRAMHGENLGAVKFVLKRYLEEWLGGPKLYSQSRGHPRLRMRHLPFAIGPPEREAWFRHMTAAVELMKFDAPVRDALIEYFEAASRAMINKPANA